MNKFEAIEILEEVKILDDSMYQYNITYLNALDMAIKSLKTEAIPVEWLKERYKIEGYYGTDEYFRKAHAVKEIIADWEAEQGKEE